MVSISLCMIVKDEEEVLSRCLSSISNLVDEIIIVDTGSSDKTVDIAKEFTDKIYFYKWADDFSAARNYSFFKAKMDYILWLDADDVLEEEDRKHFKDLKEKLTLDVDVVTMKYAVGFDSYGNITMSFYRERLLKREKRYIWKEPIHEYINIYGNILKSDICIKHKKSKNSSERNLLIFNKMVKNKIEFSPRNLYYFARELYYNEKYDDAIKTYNNFLSTSSGFMEDYICACRELSKCYKIKKDEYNELGSLYKSFIYDLPRGETCCSIGYYYKEKEDYNKAIYWFDAALKAKKPSDFGFTFHDYYDYIPSLELCICYYYLGDLKNAKFYNSQAEKIKPYDSAVMYNKKFLKACEEA